MSMNVDMSAVAVEAMKVYVLEHMSEEDRHKLISDAIEQILKTKTQRYGSGPDLSTDAMYGALRETMSEIYKGLIAEPENIAKLQGAAQKAFDHLVTETLHEKFVTAFVNTFDKSERY